jgi:hypothetical protein
MKKLLVSLTLSLLATAAHGGAGTITVLDSTGATKTYDVITDGTGNFVSKMGICDQSAAATCASVGTAGAPSTNALTVQPVTLGNGTSANAARVAISTDSTGTVRVVGNAGGVVDAVGQNVAAPANWLQVGCQFNTTPTTITTTNGSPAQCDSAGNLLVNVKSATGVAENTAVGTLTFSALGVEGLSTEKTAVTTGNYGRLVSDLVGKLITMPYAPNQLWVKGTTAAMTATTSTQLIAAVASNKIYLSTLTCGNSHATVGTFVNVQDGSGGTTIWTVPAAAVYGGATLNFVPPIATTNGNGVYVVNATTGANVICSGSGYSGA